MKAGQETPHDVGRSVLIALAVAEVVGSESSCRGEALLFQPSVGRSTASKTHRNRALRHSAPSTRRSAACMHDCVERLRKQVHRNEVGGYKTVRELRIRPIVPTIRASFRRRLPNEAVSTAGAALGKVKINESCSSTPVELIATRLSVSWDGWSSTSSGAFEILTPGRPVVFLPAVSHSGEVVVRYVEMNQVDSPACWRPGKTQDQSRIRVLRAELT